MHVVVLVVPVFGRDCEDHWRDKHQMAKIRGAGGGESLCNDPDESIFNGFEGRTDVHSRSHAVWRRNSSRDFAVRWRPLCCEATVLCPL